MDHGKAEAWIEINIPTKASPDVDLLRDVVDPLVHTELVGEIATWHFFWEPELRLRLRWQDPSRRAEAEHRLAETLAGGATRVVSNRGQRATMERRASGIPARPKSTARRCGA